MKNIFRMISALLLALALCLGMTACGSTPENTSTAAPENTSTEAPVSTEAPSSSAESSTEETAAPSSSAESSSAEETAAPETTAGAAAEEDSPEGYYLLYSMPAEGGAEAVKELESYGLSVFMVIEPEGKGYMHMMGEEKELSWDKAAGTVTIDGDTSPFILDRDDFLTIYDEREPYMIFYLSDEKAPERGEMKKAALGLWRTDEIIQKRQTLVSSGDVRVIAAGYTVPESIFDDYAVKLILTNMGEEKDLGFSIDHVVVNGIDLDVFFYESLSPGQTKEAELEIAPGDLKTFGIGDPTVIDIGLEVSRTGEFEPVLRDYLTIYPLGEDKAETRVREAAESDKLIVNDEAFRILFTGIEKEPAVGYTYLRFWVENESGLTASVQVGSVVYNEAESGKAASLKIAPHSAGPLTLYVSDEEMEALGGSITDIAFSVEILDRDFKTLLEEQVSFKP